MSGPFKMKGHSLPGPNQRVSPAKQKIDYKAQGDVIDKRNKAITDFDKASADMGGYTPTDSQKSQIQERKKSLADKLTSSTDSIANVNRQDRVKKTDEAFNKLMGNTPKSGKKAGKAALETKKGMPYASPAKHDEDPHTPHPKEETEEEFLANLKKQGGKVLKTQPVRMSDHLSQRDILARQASYGRSGTINPGMEKSARAQNYRDADKYIASQKKKKKK